MSYRPLRCLVLLVVVDLVLADAGEGRADIIVNSSFETPDVDSSGIEIISPGSEPAGFGWEVESGTVEVFGELHSALPGPSFDGNQHLDLNGVSIGTLSQTFATTPGVAYVFEFAYANNYTHSGPADPAMATVQVTDTGSESDLVTPLSIAHGTSTSTDLDWDVATLTFTATGNASTLRFISNSPTPLGGILLDGASVVPEPASVVMLSIGAVGLLGCGRRCRRCAR